jgi:hypothetical protein
MNNIWFGTSQKGERREFTNFTVFFKYKQCCKHYLDLF